MAILPDFTEDVNGKKIHFDGNESLKPSNCILPLTKEHIEEYIKCSEDIFYFAENYYSILNLDEGIQKIKLRDYQKEMISSFLDNRFNISLASRQCVTGDTKITIRNKKTGLVEEITMENFKNRLKSVSNLSPRINNDKGD